MIKSLVFMVLTAPVLPDTVVAQQVTNEFTKVAAEPLLAGPFTLRKDLQFGYWEGGAVVNGKQVVLRLRPEGAGYYLMAFINGTQYHGNSVLDYNYPGGWPRFYLANGTQSMMVVKP
jgi:hypothetical protein